MSLELDPRFTFDAFIAGSGNRLAVAASRRVAEAPGSTYTPLFIYSGSGLGKTHLLGAIGHQVQRVHGIPVMYETLEHLMERVSAAVAAGDLDGFRSGVRDAGLLLLDDVQFLAGQHQTQEELLRVWDALAARGAQVVLSSDRPPQEIDGLDERLLSRLSGGLIVDVSPPDYETRIAIARRKAEERGSRLAPNVIQALARVAFTNVRELQGALNRLIAVQELEQREVTPEEVPSLLGAAAERGRDEFGEFLSDISGTVSAVVEEADRMIADAILEWDGEGVRTRRLESALAGTVTTAQAEEILRRFEHDVSRLATIRGEIRALEREAPELFSDALRDPDRLADAESLLHTVRERQSPPPGPPEGLALDALDRPDSLAVRAAGAVVRSPGSAYNPLYLMGPPGSGKSTLLTALGLALQRDGDAVVAYIDGGSFAEELVSALERNRLDAWRARYRRADVLLLDDVHQLDGAEQAHEELFHLFESLHRAGRQLVFAAPVGPASLPIPDRLRSRMEAGLVVELEPRSPDPVADLEPTAPAVAQKPTPGAVGAERALGGLSAYGPAAEPNVDGLDRSAIGVSEDERGELSRFAPGRAGHWILSREKVLWEWPYALDWLEGAED